MDEFKSGVGSESDASSNDGREDKDRKTVKLKDCCWLDDECRLRVRLLPLLILLYRASTHFSNVVKAAVVRTCT